MRLLKALWFALDTDIRDVILFLKALVFSLSLVLVLVGTLLGLPMLLGFSLNDAIRFLAVVAVSCAVLPFIAWLILGIAEYINRVVIWYRRL